MVMSSKNLQSDQDPGEVWIQLDPFIIGSPGSRSVYCLSAGSGCVYRIYRSGTLIVDSESEIDLKCSSQSRLGVKVPGLNPWWMLSLYGA